MNHLSDERDMVPLSLSMLVLCSREFLPNTHFYIFFVLCMAEKSNIAVISDSVKKESKKSLSC